MDAEQRAAANAKEGLKKQVKEAEARAEAMEDTVEELRVGLERQRAAADLRYAKILMTLPGGTDTASHSPLRAATTPRTQLRSH